MEVTLGKSSTIQDFLNKIHRNKSKAGLTGNGFYDATCMIQLV